MDKTHVEQLLEQMIKLQGLQTEILFKIIDHLDPKQAQSRSDAPLATHLKRFRALVPPKNA